MTEQEGKLKASTEEKLFTMFKLDKSRRRWRLLALVFLFLALISYSAVQQQRGSDKKEKDSYIAEIKIEGIIMEDAYRLERLEKLKDDKHVKAVILTIDSPGGAMVPGLELLDYLREIQKVKPVVVQMKSMATSAGYLISLSGEYVVANKASVTGSIGVMMPLVDASELAKKIGVKSAEITSGDLKNITSPLDKRTAKAQKYLQSTVDELQVIFMDEVKIARKLDPKVEKLMSDGRIVIGQKALDYNLIDALGGKGQLLGYLAAQKNIKGLDVVEYSLEKPEESNFRNIIADRLVSGLSDKLDFLLFSGNSIPKMIAN